MKRQCPVIKIDNLSYTYAENFAKKTEALPKDIPYALKNVSFNIEGGDYIALLGANGSGKSTLLRLIGGLLQPLSSPSAGTLHMHKEASVAIVFQNPDDQIVGSTVEEDLLFGTIQRGWEEGRAREAARRWLDFCGLVHLERRPVSQLSGGEKQRLALASALVSEPSVLLLDEPLAMLNPGSRNSHLDLFDRLHREEGRTLVHITHSLEEALRAKKIIILEAGKLVFNGTRKDFIARLRKKPEPFTLPPALAIETALQKYFPDFNLKKLDPKGVAEEMLLHTGLREFLNRGGQKIDQANGTDTPSMHNNSKNKKEKLAFESKSLSYIYNRGAPDAHRALWALSVQVPQASSLALVGPSGSGKTSLLYHANATLFATEGVVSVFGYDTRDRRLPLDLLRRRANLSVQEAEAALFKTYAADDVATGLRTLKLSPKEEAKRVQRAMKEVGLEPKVFWDRPIRSLSGGEKRKLALAGSFIMDGDFLILDEPSAALDGESRKNIRSLVKKYTEVGKTLLLSTHSMEEAARCNKVLVLNGGRKIAFGNPRFIFGEGWDKGWGIARPWASELMAILKEKVPALRPAEWPLNTEEFLEILIGKKERNKEKTESTQYSFKEGLASPIEISLSKGRYRRRKEDGAIGAFSVNSFGQYLGRPSFLKDLPLLAKGLLLLIPILLLMGTFSLTISFSIFVLLLFAAPLAARIHLGEIFRNLKPAWPFLVFLIFFQLLWPRPGDESKLLYSYGFLHISTEKVLNTLHLVLRVSTFMGLFSLAAATISEREFLRILRALSLPFTPFPRLRAALDLGLQVMLRFIPLLMEEARRIRVAQYARGLGSGEGRGLFSSIRAGLALAVPLMVRSLERAERLAIAIEARMGKKV